MIAREHPVLSELTALDAVLTSMGWPALSEWWVATFVSFVVSACRTLVARVGRRGGKSSSICRFAVAFALSYDVGAIPPGDVGVVAFISTRADEAAQRLRTIKAILGAIDVEWFPVENGIQLSDRAIAFKVFPASIAGVSGFTAILVIADEVAKWRDADTGANPATEVLASVGPTMATQPDARKILLSSPLGHEDAHAKAFDLGDTGFQRTAFAETWIANPTVTKERTQVDEPDERVWLREYAAIPQAGRQSAFDVKAVERAIAHPRPTGERGPRYLLVDPSSGRKDAFSWGVVSWVSPPKTANGTPSAQWKAYLELEHVDAIEGSFWNHVDGDKIVDKLFSVGEEWGCQVAHSDQREALMLSSAFARRSERATNDRGRRGIRYVMHDWTNANKVEAVERLRRWLAEGTLALPQHDKLRRELLAFEERITPTGAFTFGARGSGHDDLVSLLITGTIAEINGELGRATAGDVNASLRAMRRASGGRWGSMPGRGY